MGPTFLISNTPAVTSSVTDKSTSTVSSVVDSNQDYQNAMDYLTKSLSSVYGSLSSSAVKAANAAADRTNSFNAQQAELNRKFQQTSAEKAMKFEADQARKAMAFNERMSNTTYQRAIADLKAAGLSPLLAYGNMQTSSPQGVSASGHSASGSSASGVKAETSSAYKADRELLSQYMTLVTLGVTSALKEVDQSIDMVKALGSVLPF